MVGQRRRIDDAELNSVLVLRVAVVIALGPEEGEGASFMVRVGYTDGDIEVLAAIIVHFPNDYMVEMKWREDLVPIHSPTCYCWCQAWERHSSHAGLDCR